MRRTDILNHFIKKINAKSYLEIGVSGGGNFSEIICENKVGVDPEPLSPATVTATSDDFFPKNKDNFDVIFIDGLHHADQVYRDIKNSLNFLNDGGVIVCHDMNPQSKQAQEIPYINGEWNGDCWKALVQIRQEHDDLDIYTIDTDQGCSVITKSNEQLKKLVVKDSLTYDNLVKNREEWLNLISVGEFNTMEELNKDYKTMLLDYINDPDNAEYNFALALYYDDIGQTASALSFYLRTAERTQDTLLRYECLIRGSMCFNKQGTRKFTVKGMLQHAVTIMPKRPEAYYMLSVHYEKQENDDGKWFDSYLMASVGLEVSEFENMKPLRTEIDYKDKYQLLFQKAHTSWWCGLCDDSREIFLDLYNNYKMNDYYTNLVYSNLANLNAFRTEKIVEYDRSKADKLKVKFEGLDRINKNYSESYQDMFVLTMLNGKEKGRYLEIGAGNTFYGNNTALLEQEFGWRGVSLDVVPEFVDSFARERTNPCLLKNATTIDYEKFLNGLDYEEVVDYLQIDCDPADVSLKVLYSMPFEKFKFRVITFEHDHYADQTKSVRDKSRKFLESYGYMLVAADISPDDKNRPYEDWWVHSDLVDNITISKMTSKDKNIKSRKAEDYMMGRC